MRKIIFVLLLFLVTGCFVIENKLEADENVISSDNYVIVDTNQSLCYDNYDVIECLSGFNGQDADYIGNEPSYKDNGDGTVSDLNTGLMWQKAPGDKVAYYTAINNVDSFELAGYSDWRVPSIKEFIL